MQHFRVRVSVRLQAPTHITALAKPKYFLVMYFFSFVLIDTIVLHVSINIHNQASKSHYLGLMYFVSFVL